MRRLNTLMSTHLAALHEAVVSMAAAIGEVLLPNIRMINNAVRLFSFFLLAVAVINYLAIL